MHDTDLIKAIVSLLGSLAGAIRIVTWFIDRSNTRKLERIKRIPPTVCPLPEPRPPDNLPLAVRLRVWELQESIVDLRARLATCDAGLQAATAELYRSAVSLASSRHREQVLMREFEEYRKAVESGHTRLPLPRLHPSLRTGGAIEINVQHAEEEPTIQERAR